MTAHPPARHDVQRRVAMQTTELILPETEPEAYVMWIKANACEIRKRTQEAKGLVMTDAEPADEETLHAAE